MASYAMIEKRVLANTIGWGGVTPRNPGEQFIIAPPPDDQRISIG